MPPPQRQVPPFNRSNGVAVQVVRSELVSAAIPCFSGQPNFDMTSVTAAVERNAYLDLDAGRFRRGGTQTTAKPGPRRLGVARAMSWCRMRSFRP
jgi:hypothetical protein